MNKGDKVTIYKDPYTEQEAEGEATLLEKIDTDDLFEQWLIRFDGDDERSVVQRYILKSS